MAVINNSDPDPEPSTSTATQGSEGTGDSIGRINDLLENVEQLLNNDFVQNRLADKMDNKGGGQQGVQRQRPMPQQHPQKQRVQQTQPEPQGEPTQEPQGKQVETLETDIDLRDYFSKKIVTPEGREELSEQIGALTEYLDPDSTLEQIEEELTSEEFVQKINQLQQQGILPDPEGETSK